MGLRGLGFGRWINFGGDEERENVLGELGAGKCLKKLKALEVVADEEFGKVNLEILKAFVGMSKKNRELLEVNKELTGVYGKLEELGFQKKMIVD